MSSSALRTQVYQALASNTFNADTTTPIYSAGAWDFKNASAVTSVKIDASGNVGIGTSSPAVKLHVSSSAAAADVLRVTGGTQILNIGVNDVGGGSYVFEQSAAALRFGTSNTERMRLDSSGNLLVGTTSSSFSSSNGLKYVQSAAGANIPQLGLVGNSNNVGESAITVYSSSVSAYRFYVQWSGNIYSTSTSITAISDRSLKENIKDLETGLAQVLALQPRRFDWNSESGLSEKNVAGFIAQEVEQVLPELVYEYKYTENESKKGLKMGDILPTLVKAIQELSAKVDAQAAEIEALKAK